MTALCEQIGAIKENVQLLVEHKGLENYDDIREIVEDLFSCAPIFLRIYVIRCSPIFLRICVIRCASLQATREC